MTTLPSLRTGTARHEQGVLRPVDGLEIPYGLVEGDAPGPCLLVTAGVHGSEYCSIEAALRLMRRSSEGLRGTILVLPILNPTGFRNRSVYVMPEDGQNLNRMFPGDPNGSISQRLADWLVTAVYPQADAYIDLHGGDLSEALEPFSLFPLGSEASEALAVAFGLPIAVEDGGEGYTINAAGRLGIPSIIAEVSGNGLWDDSSVADLTAGIERVLQHVGMSDPSVPPVREQVRIMTMWVPSAGADGLWYPAKRLPDEVAAGETVGEIKDVYGTVLETVTAREQGRLLYQLSSLVVNRGEALLGIGTSLAGR